MYNEMVYLPKEISRQNTLKCLLSFFKLHMTEREMLFFSKGNV